MSPTTSISVKRTDTPAEMQAPSPEAIQRQIDTCIDRAAYIRQELRFTPGCDREHGEAVDLMEALEDINRQLDYLQEALS